MRLGNEVLFRLRMTMRRFCLATTSKARLLSCALVRELTLDNYLISFPAEAARNLLVENVGKK